jgi:uncharacterized protein (TIGR03437 family)
MILESRHNGRLLAMGIAAFLLAMPLQAYYHYVHYASRNAPFTPIYEKFDLTKLPNQTVTFFVSDQGPSVYATNDSFGSVLSQIKQAAAAWNSVNTSALRVAFGGLESYTANPTTTATGGPILPSSTPGADVIFVDLPGVVGLGAPTTSQTPVQAADGSTFFPILRGIVMLSRDTTSTLGPSYYENFYTTAVHEIGHALGLQHTWTSSAMSQGVVRNTSRARPLDADDRAAISMLYGVANWRANFGSISGKVTYSDGTPVALASVVAIAPAGSAVSALTNPDGTYEIDGIPATSNYLVYVHPLPPDALNPDESGIRFPKDPNGQPFAPSGDFQTVFYPGTLDPTQATVIQVGAGTPTSGVNFAVQPRGGVPAYDLITLCRLDTTTRTYVYSGNMTVPNPNGPGGGLAFIDSTIPQDALVTIWAEPSMATPMPQAALILGGLGNAISIQRYTDGSGAVALYFQPLLGAGTGPRHLVLNFGDDIFVQPDAVTLVQQGPPLINSVVSNPDGSVTISGAGLRADSSVYFDGLQTTVATPYSGTPNAGSITVVPPPATGGQTSTLTIYNSDSQNSMIMQGANPPTYTYPSAPAPQISGISQPSLPAGSTAGVDLTLPNANLVDGQVTVGFGSNDVTVRRVWVLSPTHLVANVVVAPGAAIGASQVSVISGLEVVAQPFAFQTQVAQIGLPVIALPVENGDPNQQTIYPGAVATIYGQNLVLTPSTLQLTLNDVPVQVLFASAGQINFVVPANMPLGPSYLKLNNGQQSAFPVVVQIDYAPPSIAGISNFSNVSLLGLSAASGDLVNLTIFGLDPTVPANPSRLRVTVGGVNAPVVALNPLPNNAYQVQIVLQQSFSGNQVPVQVWVDGSSSQPVLLAVR